jgi:dTDP-glucose 4,6-dehydratase
MGHERFRFEPYDVTGFLSVSDEIDLGLHLASPASPRDYLEWPIETLKVGAIGTSAHSGWPGLRGPGFFLASTSQSYGDPKVHPQPEGYWGNVNPVGPRSVFDEAKRFAEAL